MNKSIELIRERTSFSEQEIALLSDTVKSLPLIAKLTASDVFLDVPCTDGTVLCAAQVHPAESTIEYYGRVTCIGNRVSAEDEPGVFMVLQTGKRYNNQLGKAPDGTPIKQDVVPIINGEHFIGALIKEEDCSKSVLSSRKYESLVRSNAFLREVVNLNNGKEVVMPQDARYLQLRLKEVNHRIKNSLQTIASIMRMEARRSADPVLIDKLRESAARIHIVANIHDMLSASEGNSMLNVRSVLEKLLDSICSYTTTDFRLSTTVEGDACALEYEKITAISLAVNELVSNALKYAFVDRRSGKITVKISCTDNYKRICVIDDGVGFDPDNQLGLGLHLAESVVREKLNGRLVIGPAGTPERPAGTKALIEWR